MPTLFVGFILLLTVAVIFGYFYLKRAQARDAVRTNRVPAAPTDPAAASTTGTSVSSADVAGDGQGVDRP